MITVEANVLVECPYAPSEIERAVEIASRYEKKIKTTVEINIVGFGAIKELNRRYRGLDMPTDVLSFSWNEATTFPTPALGQIYLCYPYIVRQAKRFKVPTKEEFNRMLVHGLLHLAAHDHQEEGQAKKMFALQEKILAAILDSKDN